MLRHLSKEEVTKAVEFKRPPRIPLVRAKWFDETSRAQYGAKLDEIDEQYPTDAIDPERFLVVDFDKMGLSWELPKNGAIDNMPIVDDWAKLDEFIAKMPDPLKDTRIDALIPQFKQAHRDNRYITHTQWSLFFERPWQIRGMQNLLMDYYINPKEIHKLHEALCDLYLRYIDVVAAKLKPDGYWASDDLGDQQSLMISPEIFREFIKPYYRKIGEKIHQYGMHWWQHTCGNNIEVLEDLIDVGIDMLHPIQKGAMDREKTAEIGRGRIGFSVGMDVVQVLRRGSVEDVKKEVRAMIDLFDTPDGGMAISAGNSISAGVPLANIRAFLDESLDYGRQHRAGFLSRKR